MKKLAMKMLSLLLVLSLLLPTCVFAQPGQDEDGETVTQSTTSEETTTFTEGGNGDGNADTSTGGGNGGGNADAPTGGGNSDGDTKDESGDEDADVSEEEAAPTVVEMEEVVLDLSDMDLPDNDELFAAYVEREFDRAAGGGRSPVLYAARSATHGLTSEEAAVYNELKNAATLIANGTNNSTKITLTAPYAYSYSAAELGVSEIVDSSSTLTTEAKEKAKAKVGVAFEKMTSRLWADCPYEFYWCDKRLTPYGFTLAPDAGNTKVKVTITEIDFTVAESYRDTTATEPAYTVTSDLAKVSEAVTNAGNIVDTMSVTTDRARLEYFRDAICDRVEYNYAAAGSSGYGDPWQMIYVFDNDSGTNVVCEGYAKAFQYLCELAISKNKFDDKSLECYNVTGQMDGGNHMWNVVEVGNARYLVDVTNCDGGHDRNGLFLKVVAKTDDRTYTFTGLTTISRGMATYFYGTDMKDLFCAGYPALRELQSIAIATKPTKTTYAQGENFDKTGMVVTATYSDGSTTPVADYTVENGNNLAAGSVNVTIKYAELDNVRTETQAVTVSAKKSLNNATITITEPTYTGSAQTVGITVEYDGVTLTNGTDYTVTGTQTLTDVRATDVPIVITGKGNYEGTVHKSWNLKKATSTCTAPTGKTGLEYDGTAKELVTAWGSATGGTLEYSLDGSSWNTAKPTFEGTNAGTYTLHYRVNGGGNYEDITAQQLDVEIAKKAATITVHAATKKVGNPDPSFTGTVSGLVTSTDLGMVIYERAAGDATKNNVGDDITITATYTANSNYDVTLNTAKLTITAKDTQTLSFASGSISKTYGDPEFTNAVGGNKTAVTYTYVEGAGVISVDASTGKVTILKSGTATVKATAAENPTYAAAEATYTINVAKKNVTITTNPTASVTYGDPVKAADLTGGVASEAGVFTWMDSVTTYGDATTSGAKTLYAKFTPNEPERYETVENIAVSVMVARRSISAATIAAVSDVTYDTNAHTPEPAVTLDGKTLVKGSDINYAYSPNTTNVGTVTVTVTGINNYEGTRNVTFNINQAMPVAENFMFTAPTVLVYDGSNKTATVTAKGGITGMGAVTVKYFKDGSLTTDTKAVGTYVVKVNVAAGTNYAAISDLTAGEWTFTVTRANASVTAAPAAVGSLGYDGSAKNLITAGTCTGGTMNYRLGDSGAWGTAIPQATNAGTYTVWYKVVGDGNHNDTAAASVTVTIARQNITPSVTVSGSYTYNNGNPITPTVEVKNGGATLTAGTDYDVLVSDNTNAGTGKVTVKERADSNYTFTEVHKTFSIGRANQATLTVTGGTSVVYGETLTLGTSGGSGTGAVTYTVTDVTGKATITGNVLTPTQAGTVKVKATKAADTNYNAIDSAEVEITIAQATPTGAPKFTKITSSGKTLGDAALVKTVSGPGDGFSVAGTVEWVDGSGTALADSTSVEANKSYGWKFTPTDSNYKSISGSVVVYTVRRVSHSGGAAADSAAAAAQPTVYSGSRGESVKTLQAQLNAKGFNAGSVDGIFGKNTQAAVMAFQKANGLAADGIVGKLTWAKLYDTTAALPAASTATGTQPMVYRGSRGDAVRKLQELLNKKGFDCGAVDGIFGSKTYAAVVAFQKANGLSADGIVGPLTWGKLG